jgi:hypothetical protein
MRAEPLAIVTSRFRDRIDAPRWWTYVAFTMPRLRLALLVALVPAVALFVAALLAPAELARAVTRPENVHETFARFVSAVATASAIAVSIASLSFRGELKGIRSQRERHEANERYRDRVRAASGEPSAPITIASFLAFAFDSLRDEVARVRASASPDALATRAEGVTLGDFLDAVDRTAARCARKVVRVGRSPTKLAGAAYDFEEEVTSHYARVFARDERLPRDVRDGLQATCERLDDIVTATKYAKTLGMSFGMGRMSLSIALASIPSIATAALMTLSYGEGAVNAWGTWGAAALVALAFAVVLYPMAVFVSFITRFLFLNQHSLPTDAFVLGPEEPDAFDIESHGATRTMSTGRRPTG